MQRILYAWIVFLIYILLTSGIHSVFHIPYFLLHVLLGLCFYFLYGLKGAVIAIALVLLLMLVSIVQLMFFTTIPFSPHSFGFIGPIVRNVANVVFFILVGNLGGCSIAVLRKFV